MKPLALFSALPANPALSLRGCIYPKQSCLFLFLKNKTRIASPRRSQTPTSLTMTKKLNLPLTGPGRPYFLPWAFSINFPYSVQYSGLSTCFSIPRTFLSPSSSGERFLACAPDTVPPFSICSIICEALLYLF